MMLSGETERLDRHIFTLASGRPPMALPLRASDGDAVEEARDGPVGVEDFEGDHGGIRQCVDDAALTWFQTSMGRGNCRQRSLGDPREVDEAMG